MKTLRHPTLTPAFLLISFLVIAVGKINLLDDELIKNNQENQITYKQFITSTIDEQVYELFLVHFFEHESRDSFYNDDENKAIKNNHNMSHAEKTNQPQAENESGTHESFLSYLLSKNS